MGKLNKFDFSIHTSYSRNNMHQIYGGDCGLLHYVCISVFKKLSFNSGGGLMSKTEKSEKSYSDLLASGKPLYSGTRCIFCLNWRILLVQINKSPNLWLVASILVCCIFDCRLLYFCYPCRSFRYPAKYNGRALQVCSVLFIHESTC